MAPYVTCYIFLQVFLLGSAYDLLTINPNNPTVPLEGSIKLNCSINNPSCTTYWKGLDINLGSVYTATGYSILMIENASIAMEGTKICIETCADRRKDLVHTVALHVYALPETLLLSTSIKNGIPSLHCLMKGIYPIDSLIVQCYRGTEKLNEHSDNFTQDEDIGIYNVMRSFDISNDDLKSQTSYKCESELSVGRQTFRMEGMLEIPKEADTLARTVTNADNQNTAMTTGTPDTDSTTLYIKTPQKSTLSLPSTSTVFSSVSTHKRLPTSDTVLTTDTLPTTMSNTKNQNTTIRTPKTSTTSTYSTTVYTRTSKERTPSPPSMVFSGLNTHRKPSTPDTVQTIDHVTTTKHQTTDLNTRIPTTCMTLSSQAASTAFSSYTTHKLPLNSGTDDINVMWMAVPAIGLAGSILIFLQIWRQLNKKGFFQPNQSPWSDCKHGSKDLIYSLEAGSLRYVSVK